MALESAIVIVARVLVAPFLRIVLVLPSLAAGARSVRLVLAVEVPPGVAFADSLHPQWSPT
jgi:hypothetical protein